MRSHPVLIIQSTCSYILALILDWATVFVKICWSVVEITPHFVDKLSFDIYLLITVHFCFSKKFFVLVLALIVLMFFLCSSKSHCSFKIVPIKKECNVVCLLSFINVCVFFFLFHWPVFTRLFRIIIAYIESKN